MYCLNHERTCVLLEWTLEPLDGIVDESMTRQLVAPVERLRALVTRVRRRARVDEAVLFEVVLSPEAFLTDLAHEARCRVRKHMR